MDLAELRLKYGPSLIRTAASPKRLAHSLSDGMVKGIMRPEAPPFVVGSSFDSLDRSELRALTQSLCRTLAIEREARQATEIALKEAQSKIEGLRRKNQTITATNMMLKSIVIHNTRPGKVEAIEVSRTIAQQDEGRGLFANKTENLVKQKSIFFDVLDQQRAGYEEKDLSQVQPTQKDPESRRSLDLERLSKSISGNIAPPMQEARALLQPSLNDAGLAKELSPPKNVNKAEVQESSDLVEVHHVAGKTPTNALCTPLQTSLGPRNSRSSTGLPPIHSLMHVGKAHKPQRCPYNTAENQEHASLPNRQPITKPGLSGSETPCLDVPVSFLSKYPGPPRAPLPPHKLCIGDSTSFIPAKVQVCAESEDGSDFVPEDNSSAVLQQESHIHLESLTRKEKAGMEQINPKQPPMVEYRLLPGPGDFSVTWKMHSNPLDASSEQCRRYHFMSRNCRPGSQFWRHPVRYLPSFADKNLYRTIMIDYIPLGATHKDVLATIRTGAIESIEIFPPIGKGKTTRYLTARVVFPYEDSAYFLLMQARNDAIEVKGHFVRVWQPQTATYPRSQQFEDDIYMERYTRLLVIQGAEAALPKLLDKLAFEIEHEGSVLEIGCASDGVPMIEFTNIASAVNAWKRFQGDEDFKGGEYDFETDYTDQDALERMCTDSGHPL